MFIFELTLFIELAGQSPDGYGRIDYHYGGLPGCPAGPAATRPIGLTDACMNNDNNNNNSSVRPV